MLIGVYRVLACLIIESIEIVLMSESNSDYSMTPKMYAKQRFIDGTLEQIEFAGRTVGFLGETSDQTEFVWNQTELYAKSDFNFCRLSPRPPGSDSLSH